MPALCALRRRFGSAVILPIGVVAALLLGRPAAVSAEDVPILGYYALTELARGGDDVLVSLTLQLRNETDVDVRQARVSVERPDDPSDDSTDQQASDPESPDRMFAQFPAADIRAHGTVRLSQNLLIPASEWASWQSGRGPRLAIAFIDDSGQPVRDRLALVQVGEIPAAEPF